MSTWHGVTCHFKYNNTFRRIICGLYVTDNTIQEIIRFPKGMVINDVRHPRTIFKAWSWDELNAVGIYTVEAGTQGDDRFEEITSSPTYAFDSTNKKGYDYLYKN